MNAFKVFTVRRWVVTTAVVVSLLLLFFLDAAAQGTVGIVRPEPVSHSAQAGAETTIFLVFENIEALYGLEIHLTFDPNVLEVIDTDATKPGVQIQAETWLKDGFVAVNQADNSKGTVDFAATLLNPAPPVSGSKSFAIITFKAKSSGVSPLIIQQAILSTRDAVEIPTEWQSGQLEVAGSSEEAAAADTSSHNSVVQSVNAEETAPASNRTVVFVVAGVGVAVFVLTALVVGALFINRRVAK